MLTKTGDEEIKEIRPHWRDGVPTKFNTKVLGEGFFRDGNYHSDAYYYVPLELTWNTPQRLSALNKNKHLLPGTYSSEWSGVYRIFCTNAAIDRYCGKDETGTLYIGMAGAGKRKWSILRNRIKAIADGEHHALNLYHFNEMVRLKFPWDCLAVEWAFYGR